MSEYTPDDDEFRCAWMDQPGAKEEHFDQFLDRTRAEAWERGLRDGERYHIESAQFENGLWDTEPGAPANPYREEAGL